MISLKPILTLAHLYTRSLQKGSSKCAKQENGVGATLRTEIWSKQWNKALADSPDAGLHSDVEGTSQAGEPGVVETKGSDFGQANM